MDKEESLRSEPEPSRNPHASQEKDASESKVQSQPSVYARLRLARREQRPPPVEVGRRASKQVTQLLDQYREARRLSAHHGGLGPLAGRPPSLQHWQQVAKNAQPGAEHQLCRLHE